MLSRNRIFNIALIGDPSTGKTTLLQRYLVGRFVEDLRATLGVNFCSKSLEIGGDIINLQIWDFGGNNRFNFLVKSYCQDIDAILFVYDLTNSNSLYCLEKYMNEIHFMNKIPILFVIGTKSDLNDAQQFQANMVTSYAQSQGAKGLFEVSSKTGANVSRVFEILIDQLCHPQKASRGVFL